MDLQLLVRVFWRFRLLMATGLILASALAIVSYARIELRDGRPTFSYRDVEQWESLSTLFVTTAGFPWGSLDIEAPEATRSADAPPFDPEKLTSLASLYMELATSDDVLRLMLKDGPIEGLLQSFPVYAGRDSRGALLPMLTLSAVGTTPESAQGLASRHIAAFTEFLRNRQSTTGIPVSDRVVVEIVRQPQPAVLLEPRKKTRPIIAFLTVMLAVSGLALVLENVRPRVRPVHDAEVAATPHRRSA